MNSNPALKISNYSKFSKKVFEELDYARTNPRQYAKKLLEIRNSMKDNIININGYGIYYTEGTAAFDEAIEFLKSYTLPSKLTLYWSQGIVKSSDGLLNLLILHEGIEGMPDIEKSKYDLDKRMNHYGASFGELDELIDYGTFDPEFVVVNFIVGDGDPERKERQIVFNPLIKHCGISAGLLPSNKMCTVINLAEYFYNPGELVPQLILQKFTNLNLVQVSNQTPPQITDEIKTRKRNVSTKLYQEKEEKFKEKNQRRGVISLDNGKVNNESGMKKEANDNVNKKDLTVDNSLNKKQVDVVKENKESSSIEKKTDLVDSKINEEDDFNLPENVESIKLIEKTVKDKTTGKDVVVVKKVVIYNDGNQDITIYKKQK